jgi:hypothetical protein
MQFLQIGCTFRQAGNSGTSGAFDNATIRFALAPDTSTGDMAVEIHQYLCTTATITTQWFFFTGTVNAAVGAWILRAPEEPPAAQAKKLAVIARFFVLCDCLLAFMYMLLLPLYYGFVFWVSSGENRSWFLGITLILWALTSVVLGSICAAMASFWRKEQEKFQAVKAREK